jgi:hypothetical protein
MPLVIIYICNYALASYGISARIIDRTLDLVDKEIDLIIYVIMLALLLETKYFTNVKLELFT